MPSLCDHCGYQNPDHARFCAQCGTLLEAASASDDPLIGLEVQGRYRLVRVLGEGGMGRVYLAHQKMGSALRNVAIKMLTTSLSDTSSVTRFERECETVVQLAHPNTIRFYDFGTLHLPGGEDRLFIAMEYIDGRALTKAIADGPMPIPEVERIVRQIGGALSEAHRRGIVHRDLKPDNILLARSEEEGEIVKVCDFGIAKREGLRGSEVTAEGTIVGTPAYMSPEQVTGTPVDERSDVYALGLITYEMLTGSRPFVATSPLEWATQHLTGDPRSFDDFPSTRALDVRRRSAIMRALAKLPDARTASVRRFVQDLTGEQVGMPTPPAGPAPLSGEVGTAATLAATPMPISPLNTPAASAGSNVLPTLAGLSVLGLLAGAFVGAWYFEGRHATADADAGVDAGPLIDAAPEQDAGPADWPDEWVGILHYENRVTDGTAALGAPDGRCAYIAPGGTITLELTPGARMMTDGGEGADLRVIVMREESVAYRLDVGAERNQYTTIAQGLVDSIPLDVDQWDIPRFRYVRIKNRERQGRVCVDAVGVWRHAPS